MSRLDFGCVWSRSPEPWFDSPTANSGSRTVGLSDSAFWPRDGARPFQPSDSLGGGDCVWLYIKVPAKYPSAP